MWEREMAKNQLSFDCELCWACLVCEECEQKVMIPVTAVVPFDLSPKYKQEKSADFCEYLAFFIALIFSCVHTHD